MVHMSQEVTRDSLRRCIHPLLLKLVSGTLQDVEGWDVRGSEPLGAVVRVLEPRRFQESPLSALEAVLVRLAALLRYERIQLAGGTQLPIGPFVPRLLGQEEVVVEHRGKKYDQLIADIQKGSGVEHWTVDSKNALTASIRERVATTLYAMYMRANAGSSSSGGGSTIERPTLVARILRTIDDGRPAALFGLSGNGKTVIARQALAAIAHGSTATAVVRGTMSDDASFFANDVHRAVAEYGFENASWSREENLAVFERLLSTPGAFAAVLLDDVDLQTARQLVSEAAVPILLTSRVRLPLSSAEPLLIDEMESSEALELFESLVADPTADKDRELLCAHLGNRPLPVYLAARLIARGHRTLPDLLSDFERSSVRTLDAADYLVSERVNAATVEVYKAILSYCASVPRLARAVGVLTWMTGPTRRMFFNEAAQGPFETTMTTLELDAALSELEDLGLVRVGPTELDCNTLTMTVLRELLMPEVEASLHELYERAIAPGAAEARRWYDGEAQAAVDSPAPAGPAEGPYFQELQHEAFQLEFARLLLRPSVEHGAICISRGAWLLWQRNGSLFAEQDTGSRSTSLALAAIEPLGLRLWHRGSARRADGETARKVYHEATRVYRRLHDGLRWKDGASGVLSADRAVRDNDPIESLHASADTSERSPTLRTLMLTPGMSGGAETLKHALLSAIPLQLLGRLNIPCWTECGLLTSSSLQSSEAAEVNCPVCLSDADTNRSWRAEAVRVGLTELVEELAPDARWWVRAMVFEAAAHRGTSAERRDYARAGLDSLQRVSDPYDVRVADAYAISFAAAIHFDDLSRCAGDPDALQFGAEVLWDQIRCRPHNRLDEVAWEFWLEIGIQWALTGRLEESYAAVETARTLAESCNPRPEHIPNFRRVKELMSHIVAECEQAIEW